MPTYTCMPRTHVLSRDTSVVNEAYYIRLHVTGMGTHMEPSYANRLMGKFEDKFI